LQQSIIYPLHAAGCALQVEGRGLQIEYFGQASAFSKQSLMRLMTHPETHENFDSIQEEPLNYAELR
jgi:hypothetical protein